MKRDLIILVGLTGVGKSSTVRALERDTNFILLPNRRELTDTLIIPEIQNDQGMASKPVRDRLERFALTRLYREKHPGGMAHALASLLGKTEANQEGTLIFDNLRGLNEVAAAAKSLPQARFILLDAPDIVRVKRLVGRSDSFDHVAGSHADGSNVLEALKQVPGIDRVFDLKELQTLSTLPSADPAIIAEMLLSAVRIIVAERQNYEPEAVLSYLQAHLDAYRFLYLDTGRLSLEEVALSIRQWLSL